MKKVLARICTCLLVVLALCAGFLTAEAASEDDSLPVITKQPADVSAYEGETVKISVKAEGDGLSYQWQWSGNGKKWYDSSIRTSSGRVKVRSDNNGRQYRCVITDRNGKTVISDVLTITMKKVLSILKQPADVSAYEGEYARISVEAEGDGLSYQWQWSDDGGTWEDSSIRAASGKVRVRPVNNGRQYRCVVTDQYGSTVISDAMTVTMRKALSILKQPVNVSAGEGEYVRVSVKAEGDGLSYLWQWSDDGSTWEDSAIRAASGKVRVRPLNDGRRYRCVITDQYGTSVISGAMRITMNWVLSSKIEELIAFGKQYLGTPYVYGGESLTKGIDCSSFTQQCYAHIGVKLERTSYWQVNQGTAVSMEHSAWRPGDLIFYNVDGKIGHVAIYIGGGKVLQSAQSVGGVCISDYNYNGNIPARVRRYVND